MTLTVGYHQLDAKRVALKKPFLLISKVSGAASVEYQVGLRTASPRLPHLSQRMLVHTTTKRCVRMVCCLLPCMPRGPLPG